jgi:hypothetical protein
VCVCVCVRERVCVCVCHVCVCALVHKHCLSAATVCCLPAAAPSPPAAGMTSLHSALAFAVIVPRSVCMHVCNTYIHITT